MKSAWLIFRTVISAFFWPSAAPHPSDWLDWPKIDTSLIPLKED